MYGDTLSVPSVTTSSSRRTIHSQHLLPIEPPSPPDRFVFFLEQPLVANRLVLTYFLE
jgi:hypothetical protein